MAGEQEASRASELAKPRACFPASRLHGQRRNFLDAATISMGIMGIVNIGPQIYHKPASSSGTKV
jgi:hypothetical protein